ncbi:MAG: hypothetical protein U9R15_10950, partial [Chloroflexota bacterium]|nr:hypothetical protein [Chloroflexota bacterium]
MRNMKVAGKFGFNEETPLPQSKGSNAPPARSKGSNAPPARSKGSNAPPTRSKGSNAPAADRRSRLAKIRWPIAYKLTTASVLMIVLTLLAGGVGLWQVLTIGQAIGGAREKELQRARSLELLAAGHRLVASLDRMLVTQDQALMSTDVPVSLGTLIFYMETLHEAGGEPDTFDLLEEMCVTYNELCQGVSE